MDTERTVLVRVRRRTVDLLEKALPNMPNPDRIDTLWRWSLPRVDFILGERFSDRKKRLEIYKQGRREAYQRMHNTNKRKSADSDALAVMEEFTR